MLNIMTPYKPILFVILFISFVFSVNAQLSSGGFPLELPPLKSRASETKVMQMPAFKLDEKLLQQKLEPLEKSVKFAHSFEVELTPDNSGEWFEANGFKIWQLRLKSEGALSVNLIFSKYYLPDGARLFVFDPAKEVILGAFTSKNNKPFKKLAIYPLPGDELVLQYEEPVDAAFCAELEISKINHDFLGVVPLKNRWKRRPSGDCNVDVNCERESGLIEQKRAVCRILADDELGTATLLNNTAADGKPYMISAFHVFDSTAVAQITLFDFNYESPFCTGIDGYDNQSISGAEAKAAFDSLDFMLVELSEMPPASFAAYYAGWDAATQLPSNSYTIHHPNGDTKKISHDEGTCDSLSFSRNFLKFGHWEVHNWESGTTEAGSSGAPLFDNNKRVVGTLSGGYASCDNLSYDAFARLDKMWNYKNDSTKQLKYWLDSENKGTMQIDGFDYYAQRNEACTVVSNFMTEDELAVFSCSAVACQVDEFAERFMQFERASISGVSLGIERLVKKSLMPELIITVYTGENEPSIAEKQFRFSLSSLTQKAMNYFDFGEGVDVNGTFYIGVSVPGEGDSVLVYHSKPRGLAGRNTMYLRSGQNWLKYENVTEQALGASLLAQVNVCATVADIDSVYEPDKLIKLYPNPANQYVIVEIIPDVNEFSLSVFDMAGRKMFSQQYRNRRYADLDIDFLLPGIYLLNANVNGKNEVKKLIITGY